MIDFLSGALAIAYLVAGAYFLRYWQSTRDRLFLSFALAFWLMMLNQIIAQLLGPGDERTGLAYVLRVVGFLLILAAIIQKNTAKGLKTDT